MPTPNTPSGLCGRLWRSWAEAHLTKLQEARPSDVGSFWGDLCTQQLISVIKLGNWDMFLKIVPEDNFNHSSLSRNFRDHLRAAQVSNLSHGFPAGRGAVRRAAEIPPAAGPNSRVAIQASPSTSTAKTMTSGGPHMELMFMPFAFFCWKDVTSWI